MVRDVKNGVGGRRGGVAVSGSAKLVPKTRISSKHQVTIAKEAFDQAGFRAGDVLTVRAVGPGRVELTRLDELFAKHRGRVKRGAGAREAVERLRDEWL